MGNKQSQDGFFSDLRFLLSELRLFAQETALPYLVSATKKDPVKAGIVALVIFWIGLFLFGYAGVAISLFACVLLLPILFSVVTAEGAVLKIGLTIIAIGIASFLSSFWIKTNAPGWLDSIELPYRGRRALPWTITGSSMPVRAIFRELAFTHRLGSSFAPGR